MDELKEVLVEYCNKTNRRLTFEYILLKDINDSEECALELARLVKGVNCYINLIPYNETNNLGYKRSKKDTFFHESRRKNRTAFHKYGS